MAGKLTLIKSSNSFPLIKTNVESIRYILSKAYSAFFAPRRNLPPASSA